MDYFGFDNDRNTDDIIITAPRGGGKPPQSSGRGSVVAIGILMCFLVIAAGVLSVLVTAYFTVDKLTTQVTDAASQQVLTDYARQYYLPSDYSDDTLSVVSQTVNSVVIITSTYVSEGKAYQSSGSGFVVNSDGYIVTNAHVVTQDGVWNSNIKVSFYGSDAQYDVAILARNCDTEKDLAYIRVNGAPAAALKPVTIGDSNALTMGERAVVIGNAGGLGISVTSGVISRTSGALSGTSYGETKVIQTDAAVNPGNSGGPLFNYFGHCIGVVSFKLASNSNDSKYEGLGFAVAGSEITAYLTANGVDFTDNIA